MENNSFTPKEKTTLGMDQNIEALLCYVGTWITGIVFFVLETENRFVRFHALQSLIAFGLISVIFIATSILTSIFTFFLPFSLPILILITIINVVLGGLSFVLWVLLMVKAYQGSWFKLPVIGDIVEKRINSQM